MTNPTTTRYAHLPRRTGTDLDTITRYLPANYQAEALPDGTLLIVGHDHAGWTLDGYVIPRLASGLHFATEIAEPRRIRQPDPFPPVRDVDGTIIDTAHYTNRRGF